MVLLSTLWQRERVSLCTPCTATLVLRNASRRICILPCKLSATVSKRSTSPTNFKSPPPKRCQGLESKRFIRGRSIVLQQIFEKRFSQLIWNNSPEYRNPHVRKVEGSKHPLEDKQGRLSFFYKYNHFEMVLKCSKEHLCTLPSTSEPCFCSNRSESDWDAHRVCSQW